MVSHAEVLGRLQRFVCVRLDWDQIEKHKKRLKTPTQGNQVFLDPRGDYIPGIVPRGKRYPIPELLEILDRVLAEFPPKPETGNDLKLSWFLCNPRDQGLPGRFDARAVSKLDRKPLLTVEGTPPAWLDSPEFLQRHLRQFTWTRGAGTGEPRLTARMLEPTAKELESIDLEKIDSREAGRRLDQAWLEYRKVRPLVARGYIDNPHGNWLKKALEPVAEEERRLRADAEKGTLKPPGRDED